MNYLVTVIILAAAAITMYIRDERKRLRRARQFARDYAAGVAGGGRDRIDALVDATREWPPEANQPVPYLPVEVTDFDLWQAEMDDGK